MVGVKGQPGFDEYIQGAVLPLDRVTKSESGPMTSWGNKGGTTGRCSSLREFLRDEFFVCII